MEAFVRVTSVACALPQINIDTDQVLSIPDLPLTEEDTDFLTTKPPREAEGG